MRYLIGIGNYYGSDDSVGLRVAETIGDEGLDRGFTAIDLGGNLLDLVHYLDEGTEAVLIVDCARMGLAPGEHALFTPDEVETGKRLAGLSSHEGDLMKVLELARSLDRPMPPVTVLGIEPKEVGEGMDLSPELSRRFREYVDEAVRFMAES